MRGGEPPFASQGAGELLHMHIGTPPVPPRAHDPAIPEAIEAVILRALAKDPDDRFQSMAELQGALRSTPIGTVAVLGSGGLFTPVAPRPARRRGVVLG